MFLCMEALASKITYESSSRHFTCRWAERDVECAQKTCPRAATAQRLIETGKITDLVAAAHMVHSGCVG